MANYERGVYEPNDEPRVFDGAEEEEDVEGSRLPLLIVLALLVLAMFAGVVWLAYTQGVARGRGDTPVLTAAAGPERVAPQAAGGSNVPYQGFKIYEQPAPQDDDNSPAAQTPKPAEAPKPAPVVAAPPPVAAAPPATAPPKPAPTPIVAAPKPVPAPPPATPKPTPVAMAPKPAPAPVKPTPVVATPKPAPAKPTSMAALIQEANSTPAPAGGPATGAPRQLGAPISPAPTTKPAAGGAYVLQIGSYKSQADADAAWKAYKAKHAALLSGYSSDVQKVDLGEKGTWYRSRITGFADKDGATATCERLKADGGSCLLGK